MILHTFENEYDGEDTRYVQFFQRHGQPTLESRALAMDCDMRHWLETEIIGGCGSVSPKTKLKMLGLMEEEKFLALLRAAEKVARKEEGREHAYQTHFGEWTFDSLVLVPPTLRERIRAGEKVYKDLDEDPDLKRCQWLTLVQRKVTDAGYWEWVEQRRQEMEDDGS